MNSAFTAIEGTARHRRPHAGHGHQPARGAPALGSAGLSAAAPTSCWPPARASATAARPTSGSSLKHWINYDVGTRLDFDGASPAWDARRPCGGRARHPRRSPSVRHRHSRHGTSTLLIEICCRCPRDGPQVWLSEGSRCASVGAAADVARVADEAERLRRQFERGPERRAPARPVNTGLRPGATVDRIVSFEEPVGGALAADHAASGGARAGAVAGAGQFGAATYGAGPGADGIDWQRLRHRRPGTMTRRDESIGECRAAARVPARGSCCGRCSLLHLPRRERRRRQGPGRSRPGSTPASAFGPAFAASKTEADYL